MKISPSNNTSLIGYNYDFLRLKKLYDNGNLPNRIIFSGENGIGKATLAYHLINYIFSQNEKEKYDFKKNIISTTNKSYKLILNQSHQNFFLISNDIDKNNIQISKIREMISFTNKSSFNDQSKIILIDNIEFLNKNSINALLKIIEEPNSKIFFFLIHNSKIKILETLNSRCIKFNLFLSNDDKIKIINKITNSSFYNNLSDDFKNIYNSPGNIISLYDFYQNNNIEEKTSIETLLKIIIDKKLFKKDLFVKHKLSFFIELFFNKNLYKFSSVNNIYNLYKYFLLKISDCYKYNLDFENVLIEFDNKLLNE